MIFPLFKKKMPKQFSKESCNCIFEFDTQLIQLDNSTINGICRARRTLARHFSRNLA